MRGEREWREVAVSGSGVAPNWAHSIVDLADAVRTGRPPRLSADLPGLTAPQGGGWLGGANRLSREHVRWQAIDTVAAATRQPATEPEVGGWLGRESSPRKVCDASFRTSMPAVPRTAVSEETIATCSLLRCSAASR